MSPQEIFGLVLAIVLIGAVVVLVVGVSGRAGRRRAASTRDSGASPLVLYAGAGDGGSGHCSPGDSGGSCDSGGGGGSD